MTSPDDPRAARAGVVPGDVLGGKYRVERVLGEGGMGVVVAATHLQLDQRVAIKFMLPAAFENPEALARFTREARAAVRLRSEHVARVLDTGTFETGAPYIVMEYMEGADLAGELERSGPMSPQVAAEYIVQACEAIAEAHSLGIVHRDLKPANLFLTKRPDGSPLVKVLDFGISKATSPGDSALAMTKTTAVMGSPLYMSPEQMKSSKDVDPRTDVWSLGVILYELLGGRTPFRAETLGELLAAVLTEPPPTLASVRPGLPPDLCALVDRCLRKDRSLRCQNVAEIARGLAPFCPARVMPVVDRVSLIVGDGGATAGTGTPISPHAQTALPGPTPVALPAQTGGGWGGTLNPAGAEPAPDPARRNTAAWAVAIAGVIVLAVGGVGVMELRGRGKVVAESPPPGPASAVPSAAVVIAATPPVAASATPSAVTSTPSVAPSSPSTPVIAAAPIPRGAPARVPPAAPAPRPTTAPQAPAAPAPTPAAQKPSIFDTSN